MARLPELALNRIYKTIENSSTLSIRLNRGKEGGGSEQEKEGRKFGPNRLRRFDDYWIQTNIHSV